MGWGGVGLITFKYTSTHTSCYATARFSCTCTHTHTSCYATARPSCTSTHTSCYATARFSCTCTHRSCNVGVGWGGGANNVQVYFYTQVMLRYCTFLLHLHTNVMLRLWEYICQFVYRHNHKDQKPKLLWMKNKFCVLLQFGAWNDDTHKTL